MAELEAIDLGDGTELVFKSKKLERSRSFDGKEGAIEQKIWPSARRRSVSGYTSVNVPHYFEASIDNYFEDNLKKYSDKHGRNLVVVNDFRKSKAQHMVRNFSFLALISTSSKVANW